MRVQWGSKWESVEATAIRECRRRFLLAAANHPKVRLAESLRRSVFEPCQKFWADKGPSEQDRGSSSFDEMMNHLIEKWAVRHNLDYSWVHEAAWQEFINDSLQSQPFSQIPGYPPPEFPWTAWYECEGESQYKRRVKADFTKMLNAYVRVVKERRGQFLTDRESQSAHYRWSVERICLGWAYAKIAAKERSRVTPQAVAKAVPQILIRVGLPHHNLRAKKNRPSRLTKG